MDKFSLVTLINIILIIFFTYLIIIDYTEFYHGKCIIKSKEKIRLSNFLVGSLVIWSVVFCLHISEYIHYKEFRSINNMLLSMVGIEITISNIIKSLRSSEIREKGIYSPQGYFYKWSKLQSYRWILPNKIEIKLKNDESIEIRIEEEFKLEIDEIMKRKLHL